jgi:hypothetical protein
MLPSKCLPACLPVCLSVSVCLSTRRKLRITQRNIVTFSDGQFHQVMLKMTHFGFKYCKKLLNSLHGAIRALSDPNCLNT